MNVQLRPELQRFVEEKIRAGEYASTQEVVEAGIARLMLDQEGDRGEVRAWT